MKVSAITNTNFKGLFTDRTKENNGNWRMEYRPYSWENKMVPKTKIDVFSSVLPTNEEIYIGGAQRELSKDILGTVSYYKDISYGKDILRKTITEMPAMNLEESLKVKDKKLTMFLKMKQEEMQELKKSLKDRMGLIFDISKKHNEYASDFNRDVFSHTYSKETRVNGIKTNFDKMTKIAEENGQDFQKYIKLAESADNVRTAKDEIFEELLKIEEAKAKGLLIDISRRDIESPNEPLKNALQNITKAKGKLIALSNGTITVDEILNKLGRDFSIDKAIKYVENLMIKRI